MHTFMPLCLLLLGQVPEAVDTRFVQAYPEVKDAMQRTTEQDRAVLLIPGIKIHPFNSTKAAEAVLHDWQRPGSPLVKTLSKDADVFGFGYGQTMCLESIAESPGLAKAIAKLKFMGYKEIVLVGHSAGGLLARVFIEDNPESGVTRVIQICAPNDGSSWARANFTVCKEQEPFLQSLTKKERHKQCLLRDKKKIPESIEFCCVVGVAGAYGDGVVSGICQWSADLQKQGIPAVKLNTAHFTVMRSPQTIEKISEMIREPQPRWTPETVEKMRKSILGEVKK